MGTGSDYTRRLSELLLTPEEAVELEAAGSTQAAVLIPLYPQGEGLGAVFTRRHADLRRHSGEIAFPGGRQEPDEPLWDTALREAEEEIGLERSGVTIVGALPPTATFVTSYAVYPFVGVIEPGVPFRPNPMEVDEVIELALADLINGFERKRLIRRGVPIKTPTYTVRGHLIWGATARMVEQLLERIAPVLRNDSRGGASE
jgi:8-oxo-dGTP pyrophosphatase MutT (NUDIX family)